MAIYVRLYSLCTFSIFCFIHFAESSTVGFSVDLIHRDSLHSPLYNPSTTHFGRLKRSVHRSNLRARHFNHRRKSALDPIQSQLKSDSGEYLMRFSIGTPPVETLAIADTGSDLSWIQCKPCTKCYPQIVPLFDPKSSSTYKNMKCHSKPCKSLEGYNRSCSKKHHKCQYHISYGDKSYSNGHLSTETLRFGAIPVRKVVFGCGHQNDGLFRNSSSGIIGLGGGPLSLVSQLRETINGKFSYCLVPIYKGSNATSKLSFGAAATAVVSGSNVVSTPLIKGPVDTFYYLNLEKIIIGNISLEFKTNKSICKANRPEEDNGNIIIDSGTTLTYLPGGEFYDSLLSVLKQFIGEESVSKPHETFGLCYKRLDNHNVPIITFRFAGAELHFPPSTTFLEVDHGLVCFTMVPASDLALFGNLLQENFLITYDLLKKEVSFMPTDCSKK